MYFLELNWFPNSRNKSDRNSKYRLLLEGQVAVDSSSAWNAVLREVYGNFFIDFCTTKIGLLCEIWSYFYPRQLAFWPCLEISRVWTTMLYSSWWQMAISEKLGRFDSITNYWSLQQQKKKLKKKKKTNQTLSISLFWVQMPHIRSSKDKIYATLFLLSF